MIRKGPYENGLPFNIIINIMKQLITALSILHNKYKVFHGDIKTDNILVKGISNKNKYIYNKYLEYYNNNLSHEQIIELIFNDNIIDNINDFNDINNINDFDDINNDIKISLADFGTHCNENTEYNEPFGTRYYQAPEIILMGPCSYPVDIWALGCTLFELITGTLLFDPNKDSYHSRDYYHLCLINQTCGNFSNTFLYNTKYYKKYFIKNKKNKFMLKDFNLNEFDRLDRKLKNNLLDETQNIIFKKLLVNMLKINNRYTINDIKSYFVKINY